MSGNIVLRKSRERAILIKVALETYMGGRDEKYLEKAKGYAKKEVAPGMPMAEEYNKILSLLEGKKISGAITLIRKLYFEIKGGGN